jgi:Domain of unknown function (DUF4126)
MESLAYVLTSGWASGINVYATLLVIGLVGRYGDVEKVPDVLARTDVLLLTAVLTALEFVADKIPYIDSAWDAVHTAIRPTVGAILGALVAGEADDLGEAAGAVLGGTTALASHAAKASLRVAVNASPEPVSNVILSLSENAAVVGVLLLAIEHPWVALAIAGVLLVAAGLFAVLFIRAIRRGWGRLSVGKRDAEPPPFGGIGSPPQRN